MKTPKQSSRKPQATKKGKGSRNLFFGWEVESEDDITSLLKEHFEPCSSGGMGFNSIRISLFEPWTGRFISKTSVCRAAVQAGIKVLWPDDLAKWPDGLGCRPKKGLTIGDLEIMAGSPRELREYFGTPPSELKDAPKTRRNPRGDV